MSMQHDDSSPTPSRPPWHRRQRVIKPGLQVRMIGSFFGISVLALLVQFLLFGYLALDLANGLPRGGDYLVEALPRLLGLALGGSLLVLLPATLLIGISVTFRIAGPVHHIETYLAKVALGEDPGRCQIRKDDRLQELCQRVNDAVEALRGRDQAPPAAEETEAPAEAA